MKFKYIYQQISSHLSIIIVAFIVLSLFFSHYVESLVYKNKAEELSEYGQNIMKDLEMRLIDREVLSDYSHILAGRKIEYMIFDGDRRIIYPTNGRIILKDEEWNKIKEGHTVIVNQDRNQI